MAYKDFPNVQVIRTMDTGEIVPFGTFQTDDSAELKHIKGHIYVNGTIVGTEGIRLRVHSTADTSVIYAASDWVDLNTLADPVASDSLSWIRFDFNNEGINKNYVYTLTLEARNYTRNALIFYIGAVYDWPEPTYDTAGGTPLDQALGAKFFVRKELDV